MRVKLRPLNVNDYQPIITVVDEWWGGEPMAVHLPRLFFIHFQSGSVVAEIEGQIAGFLVGFRSQTHANQAYIHFVATNPLYRGQGIARQLYQHFFKQMREWGCNEVYSLTSPTNSGSIQFHQKMGFRLLPGDKELGGIPVSTDYDGPGQTLVLFQRTLYQ
ncbi:GNAT family N-acetyltransferase [Tengunoibacter tsumagoiensis]|uniref:N-acetyltransferase n=1 Tax=Tengunoibacter tsumagoiensis TaxID=2014871 RepID=A0A402AAJ4_9CHLR|nr:GNAT family N-acetyltransferase [Tengunoibacter tsumagoiensis]GCE16150.1 N-acetyltransferase [Tengunoibacter tsumagoiensis]